MSVEKFNSSTKVINEVVPYTQINTYVIQNIKHAEAGFVWVYLCSKPSNWKVIKSHIKNHFGMGDDKIKKIFAYLVRHNLIENVAVRTEDGTRISHHDIRVLNGEKFNKEVQISTGVIINPVETYTCRKPATTNKRTNKEKINNKEKIKDIRSTGVEPSFFEEFWNIYPRKEKKKVALKKWQTKNLEPKAKEIIYHIMKRLEGQWKYTEKKFIPLPDVFLNQERWTDDISESRPPIDTTKKLSSHESFDYVAKKYLNGGS